MKPSFIYVHWMVVKLLCCSVYLHISFSLLGFIHLCAHILDDLPMSIAVSTFCNENEALTEILNKPGSFHVAIVEVISFADDICHMISLFFSPPNMACYVDSKYVTRQYNCPEMKAKLFP